MLWHFSCTINIKRGEYKLLSRKMFSLQWCLKLYFWRRLQSSQFFIVFYKFIFINKIWRWKNIYWIFRTMPRVEGWRWSVRLLKVCRIDENDISFIVYNQITSTFPVPSVLLKEIVLQISFFCRCIWGKLIFIFFVLRS